MERNRSIERDQISLSCNLKYLAEKRNISITSLARLVSMNTSTLHNFFFGVCPKNIISLVRIAKYFDLTLDQLILKKISLNKDKIYSTKNIPLKTGHELIISVREKSYD